jgi:tryptophan-rich sensory protein
MKIMVSNFIWIALLQFVGFGLGKITKANMHWYSSLHKSLASPSPKVFPIAWTLLYIMIALAGSFFWKRRHEPAIRPLLKMYSIQLLLNWIWTPIFFEWKLIGLAFFLILSMISINLLIIIRAKKEYFFVTSIMTPYTIWLIFAGYLNFIIWKIN